MTVKSFIRDVFSVQTIKYMIVGSIAGGTNVVLYFVLKDIFLVNYLASNFISLTVGIIISYLLNRKHVFNANYNGKLFDLKEFIHFTTGRIFSFFLDMFLLWLLVEHTGLGSGISKFIDSAIVSVLNYLICKLLVFKS